MTMQPIEELHNDAMRFADLAVASLRIRDENAARAHYRRAMLRERQAATMLRDLLFCEPTRSALHCSAAWLAMKCGDKSEAIRLARQGITERAPEYIVRELRDILRRVGTT